MVTEYEWKEQKNGTIVLIAKKETDKKKIKRLEKENKSLNEEIERLKQNIMQDELEIIPKLEKENKKLKAELDEVEKDLAHRDSFFSIMRDVLANETITNNEIAMITYCVVHEECGDYDLSEKELEVVKKFWNRDYV